MTMFSHRSSPRASLRMLVLAQLAATPALAASAEHFEDLSCADQLRAAPRLLYPEQREATEAYSAYIRETDNELPREHPLVKAIFATSDNVRTYQHLTQILEFEGPAQVDGTAPEADLSTALEDMDALNSFVESVDFGDLKGADIIDALRACARKGFEE